MKRFNSDKILQRMNNLHPKIIDLSLNRVRTLLKSLDNPEREIPPVIHIAGTNGKGSTLSMIKHGLESHGKKVHSYTSPHLVKFHERISISGKPISETLLYNYLEECELRNGYNKITFFEITTCVAFLAFSQYEADYTLLEVGLGGRLDATNVIDRPKLTVITPISIDHEQFLGATIEKIATEKAGILKKGIKAIIGKQTKKVMHILKSKAKEIDVPLSIYGEDWHIETRNKSAIYTDQTSEVILPLPNLYGQHQVENAGIAISVLKDLGTNNKGISDGLRTTNWPARMQKLTSGPLIRIIKQHCYKSELWLDGGHNPAAGTILGSTIQSFPYIRTHLICGMMNNKNIFSFLNPLRKTVVSLTGIKIPNQQASFTSEEIYLMGKKLGIDSFIAANVNSALQQIITKETKSEPIRILICGSLYLSGFILSYNN